MKYFACKFEKQQQQGLNEILTTKNIGLLLKLIFPSNALSFTSKGAK